MKRGFAVCIFAVTLALPSWADSFDDFNQGVNAFNRGDNDRAILLLTRAIAAADLTKNLLPTALLDRGIAYENKKLYADAIPDLNASLDLGPDRFDATFARMVAYERTDQGHLAATDCDAIINMRPRIEALYSRCGLVRWENGEFAQAVSYFTSAVSVAEKPSPFDALWLEVARQRAGAPDETQFVQITKKLALDGWPSPLFDLYLGKSTPESVRAAAEQMTSRSSVPSESETAALRRRRCQSAFFVGEWQFLRHNPAAARALLSETDTYCEDWLPAKTEIKRVTQQ